MEVLSFDNLTHKPFYVKQGIASAIGAIAVNGNEMRETPTAIVRKISDMDFPFFAGLNGFLVIRNLCAPAACCGFLYNQWRGSCVVKHEIVIHGIIRYDRISEVMFLNVKHDLRL